MKNLYYYLVLLSPFYLSICFAQNVTVTGALTGNGGYSTLSEAFSGISGGQAGASILITINSSFSEIAPASLASNTWTSVAIQPASGVAVTITTAFDLLLEFNGADNVTVDGLNSGGSSLTLDCQSINSIASTVKFINDALYNTVTRCILKGSSTGLAGNISDGAVVSFFFFERDFGE